MKKMTKNEQQKHLLMVKFREQFRQFFECTKKQTLMTNGLEVPVSWLPYVEKLCTIAKESGFEIEWTRIHSVLYSPRFEYVFVNPTKQTQLDFFMEVVEGIENELIQYELTL